MTISLHPDIRWNLEKIASEYRADRSFRNFTVRKEGELYAIANCTITDANQDLEAITSISFSNPSDETSDSPCYLDMDNRRVTIDMLRNYPGYRDYTGRGSICYLSWIEAMHPGNGDGGNLLRNIMNSGYELIELEAIGPRQYNYFEKHGFQDTGIDTSNGEEILMVWHNPVFKSL